LETRMMKMTWTTGLGKALDKIPEIKINNLKKQYQQK
jgi:hypothetical protein